MRLSNRFPRESARNLLFATAALVLVELTNEQHESLSSPECFEGKIWRRAGVVHGTDSDHVKALSRRTLALQPRRLSFGQRDQSVGLPVKHAKGRGVPAERALVPEWREDKGQARSVRGQHHPQRERFA